MPWAAAAAVVGAGLAASSANKATKSAEAQSKAALDFQEDQYNDWLEVYGPLQDNLASYYTNLTPEYYETLGLETFAQEQQAAMTRLDESLAQRGIDPSSGIQASLTAQSELDAAEGRASIRRDAPRLAAEDQSRFLQIGLGQNPAQSLASTLSSQANSAQARADQAQQVAGQAVGKAVSTVGTALADYYTQPASTSQPTADTSTIGID